MLPGEQRHPLAHQGHPPGHGARGVDPRALADHPDVVDPDAPAHLLVDPEDGLELGTEARLGEGAGPVLVRHVGEDTGEILGLEALQGTG